MRKPVEGSSLSPETAQYVGSIREARAFLFANKGIDAPERRRQLYDLLTAIPHVSQADTKGVRTLTEQVRSLLISDPKSDQQSGIIARWRKYNEPDDTRVMKENVPIDTLTLDEEIELRVGDWKTAEEIGKGTPRRANSWTQATREALGGNKTYTVYRGMRLDPDQVQRIYQYGIAPVGLWRYRSFENILLRKLHPYLKDSTSSFERNTKGIISDLPLSNADILCQHWSVSPNSIIFRGYDPSAASLAISTVPADRRDIASLYGRYIVKIQVPSTQLIPRWEGPGTDYTILHCVQQHSINRIYEVKDRSLFGGQRLQRVKPYNHAL